MRGTFLMNDRNVCERRGGARVYSRVIVLMGESWVVVCKIQIIIAAVHFHSSCSEYHKRCCQCCVRSVSTVPHACAGATLNGGSNVMSHGSLALSRNCSSTRLPAAAAAAALER